MCELLATEIEQSAALRPLHFKEWNFIMCTSSSLSIIIWKKCSRTKQSTEGWKLQLRTWWIALTSVTEKLMRFARTTKRSLLKHALF